MGGDVARIDLAQAMNKLRAFVNGVIVPCVP
jgi:hypothetical protein